MMRGNQGNVNKLAVCVQIIVIASCLACSPATLMAANQQGSAQQDTLILSLTKLEKASKFGTLSAAQLRPRQAGRAPARQLPRASFAWQSL